MLSRHLQRVVHDYIFFACFMLDLINIVQTHQFDFFIQGWSWLRNSVVRVTSPLRNCLMHLKIAVALHKLKHWETKKTETKKNYPLLRTRRCEHSVRFFSRQIVRQNLLRERRAFRCTVCRKAENQIGVVFPFPILPNNDDIRIRKKHSSHLSKEPSDDVGRGFRNQIMTTLPSTRTIRRPNSARRRRRRRRRRWWWQHRFYFSNIFCE